MVKLGFVAGVRHGRGIVVIRDENGIWRPPQFVTMTGGSVGWQVGVQSSDLIMVFTTRRSVQRLLTGTFRVGVDAAAAAGPVGREAAAGTDLRLQAEILSYSRSRGLFVGASIDGSLLQIDATANQAYYAPAGLLPDGTATKPDVPLPPSASRLLVLLASLTGTSVVAAGTPGSPGPPNGQGSAVAGTSPPPAGAVDPNSTAVSVPSSGSAQPAMNLAPPPGTPLPDARTLSPDASLDSLHATRLELVRAAQEMGALLDESWRNYLALPRGVFSGSGLPSVESLEQSLTRLDAVTRDNRYQELLDRQEFQQLHGLLQLYTEQVRQAAATPDTVPSTPAGTSVPVR
jgi:lipid-binding SYLF domain-containing protein